MLKVRVRDESEKWVTFTAQCRPVKEYGIYYLLIEHKPGLWLKVNVDRILSCEAI